MIISNIYAHIKYNCLKNICKPSILSFHRRYQNNEGYQENEKTFNKGIKGNLENVQDEVEEKILRENGTENIEETYAKILMQNITQGLSVEESLGTMERELLIGREEILKVLKDYMIKMKKVKKTQQGEFILGE